MKTKLCFKPNAYGFGQDLYIMLIKSNKEAKEFWLGQMAKFFSRAIGWDLDDFVRHLREKYNLDPDKRIDVNDKKIAKEIKDLVLNTLTGDGAIPVSKLWDAESWQLSVE